MLILPWLLALATVPSLFAFYQNANPRQLLLLIAFGAGFGLAQIFFGLGVTAAGLALGFAIAIGISTVVGSLVPLVILQPQALLTLKGLVIFLGVALMIVGIVVCAIAGKKKEKQLSDPASGAQRTSGGTSFKTGLVICILAGLLSPLINFGLAFGEPLLARAAELGVSPSQRPNVLWPPLMTAALIPYLAYCVHLWRKNQSFRLFALRGTGINYMLGAIMGLLWLGSTVIYGAASTRMSAMGPILGWPLFMSSIIITANVWGFATGEWKGVGRGPVITVLVGILFLIFGFGTVALASRMG